jgi:hypothetical protein
LTSLFLSKLGYFQFAAIMNHVAMKSLTHIFCYMSTQLSVFYAHPSFKIVFLIDIQFAYAPGLQ